MHCAINLNQSPHNEKMIESHNKPTKRTWQIVVLALFIGLDWHIN